MCDHHVQGLCRLGYVHRLYIHIHIIYFMIHICLKCSISGRTKYKTLVAFHFPSDISFDEVQDRLHISALAEA